MCMVHVCPLIIRLVRWSSRKKTKFAKLVVFLVDGTRKVFCSRETVIHPLTENTMTRWADVKPVLRTQMYRGFSTRFESTTEYSGRSLTPRKMGPRHQVGRRHMAKMVPQRRGSFLENLPILSRHLTVEGQRPARQWLSASSLRVKPPDSLPGYHLASYYDDDVAFQSPPIPRQNLWVMR